MGQLLERLQELNESDFLPAHMPGHKRNADIFDCTAPQLKQVCSIDITEIDGFDNLHHACGMLKEAQNRARDLYHSKQTFYLINGSTCGILTSIFAALNEHDTILVARNCHKCVYQGIELRNLQPVYLYPDTDKEYDINVGIEAKQVKRALDSNPEIKAVFLTSPTYEGIVSKIAPIARLVHERKIPLIVDEAHGAHLGFHSRFPQSSVLEGADLVIQSLHKTLPSMTQTSLLHVCSDRIDVDRVSKYLSVFQTSSPSYVLMASIDECIHLLASQGGDLFEAYCRNIDFFYEETKNLRNLSLLNRPDKDLCKIVIGIKEGKGTGKTLYDLLLCRYHIQPEMAAGRYVLLIMTIADREENFHRLAKAVCEIDGLLSAESGKVQQHYSSYAPVQIFTPAKAAEKETCEVVFGEAGGRICAEYLYLYPPGIPYIVPGERLENEMIAGLLQYKKQGFEILGPKDESLEKIKVICGE